ncbi:MAG: extracellular solute-binding protein, partial [Lachnospiraceae bacterium]|nr:extracellular solute-binding protein [Lachnospiraceae bacterium]
MSNSARRLVTGALGILLSGAVLAGCSKEVEQKNDSLHVYAGGDDVIMDYAVREFQRRYPDIPVVYEGRKVIEDAQEFYGYNQQLSAELMSGAGADVFFIQDYWDIDKLAAAGAFADLGGLYDSSAVFQDADFRDEIMDAGLFDGKRYFLPMEYRIPMMVSTQEALDEAGFDIGKCTDFDRFMAESNRYMEREDCD